MHVLEGQVQALGPAGHEAPHEAVDVERGPAGGKYHDQDDCGKEEGDWVSARTLSAAFPASAWPARPHVLSCPTGHSCPLSILKFLEVCLPWTQPLSLTGQQTSVLSPAKAGWTRYGQTPEPKWPSPIVSPWDLELGDSYLWLMRPPV